MRNDNDSLFIVDVCISFLFFINFIILMNRKGGNDVVVVLDSLDQ